ncbi:hypothetical protein G7061_04240 [Erysipelothrix sp. HDW6B]|uniref:phage tail domain-containing protein n=1 Tax=Erysipelothrix TaxID=1647 RepID=UPI00135ADDA8|nr:MULTISPECIES: phage tail domain-containing protein [Erysipelothrix]QIK85862.1 hypothetical protein G7061_04240 [Erysipelothrix sp. HDW6B]
MIKFNGITEKELGILIKEPHHIVGRAPLKVEKTDIEGSSEQVYVELGYSSIEKSFDIQILDISKVDRLLQLFTGKVKIEYQNRYTFGHFYSQIDVRRVVTIREAKISFIRDAFWYAEDIFDKSSINTGTVYSEPIIRLEKKLAAKVDISINGTRFDYEFPAGEDYVLIDCQTKNALFENLLRNRQLKIGWEYPKLNVGENEVKLHSGDCNVLFRRKDRWL